MNPQKNKLSLICLLLLSTYATAVFAERADRNKPIKMEADRVTVDDTNKASIFEGNVKLQQGTLQIEAAKILLVQDKIGYSQITATGNLAHLRQKRDGANEYAEAFGDRIVYDSNAEIANIYGQARVKRNNDDVRGEHIIYNTKNGIFQVFGSDANTPNEPTPDQPEQGRVTIVIQPKSHVQEAAPEVQTAPSNPTTTHTKPQ
ncbi:MAG: lipopolysaccharide transport periplasmic protein LptA [Gallionellaceae bacterium]|jgi:lipopolysaccharide export system protein LptA